MLEATGLEPIFKRLQEVSWVASELAICWLQLRQVALHALVGDDGATQDACQRFECGYICPNCQFDASWSLPSVPSSQQIMFDHHADSSKPGRFPATLCVLLLQVPISKGLGENPERRRQEPLNTRSAES